MNRAPNAALQVMVSMAEALRINDPYGKTSVHLSTPQKDEDGTYVCEMHIGKPNSQECVQIALCDISYSGFISSAVAACGPLAKEVLELRARVGELEDMLQGAVIVRPLADDPTP